MYWPSSRPKPSRPSTASSQTTAPTARPSAIQRSRVGRAGQTAVVRFEVSSPAPYARHYAFAAEARS